MANVRFVRTTQYKQNNREEYDNNALYFCTDSGALYRGAQLLSDGARIVSSYSELPAFNIAADGIIYYTEDTQNGYLLNISRDGWVKVISAPITDISLVPEEEKDKVPVTVGGLVDAINETKNYVDEKISSSSAGSIDGGEV